jgi:hypothetical protein
MLYRQGDVLLKKIQKSLTDAKPVARDRGRIVLAYGEVTGHAHAIDDSLAELFEEKDGQIYLRVDAGAGVELRHEEHATITLPPGVYRVTRQREYAPDAIRNVAD